MINVSKKSREKIESESVGFYLITKLYWGILISRPALPPLKLSWVKKTNRSKLCHLCEMQTDVWQTARQDRQASFSRTLGKLRMLAGLHLERCSTQPAEPCKRSQFLPCQWLGLGRSLPSARLLLLSFWLLPLCLKLDIDTQPVWGGKTCLSTIPVHAPWICPILFAFCLHTLLHRDMMTAIPWTDPKGNRHECSP